MENHKIKIYQLTGQTRSNWPKELKKNIKKHWQNTIRDDQAGLISSLPFKLWSDSIDKNKKDLNKVYRSGLANLYLWTTANIQDDLSDEKDTPKQYLPLANACLVTAQSILGARSIKNIQLWSKILLIVEEANFKDLSQPRIIPRSDLEAANKSLFLLLSSLFLIESWQWCRRDQEYFLLAGKYFLAAKQIADDVYDFREDWSNNRRTFAHRCLQRLPQEQELTLYYQKQAQKIINLCQKCRQNMKKISTLRRGDCFNSYLDILETNCRRAFTN